jgi:hypothetical protein
MKPVFGIGKIVSGGQTGADRAAFDFAIGKGIETAGFVPLGRTDENGEIPSRYPNLTETASARPAERTELNVVHSDATVIFSHGPLAGGSLATKDLAEKHRKPFLHVDLNVDDTAAASAFLSSRRPHALNIAGPRASEDPAIYRDTKAFLDELFSGPQEPPAEN